MKKTILFALVALVTISSFAQEESKGFKGAWWGLGQFEYSGNDDASTFTILPVVGTFVTPTVTAGLGVGYTSTTIGDADAEDTVIVMPLVRKYWGVSDSFYLFGQADVPMQFFDGGKAYGFNIRPGVDYFIGGKWTVEATFGQFGYNAVKLDDVDAVGTTSLGFNMMNVNFGLKYLF